ncbi:MAG: hypothetical protein HOJ35_02120 [Bdellovibrionales bacterium]|nr:hypothetical protein [Bdellovibrionales bacterium]
MDFLTSSLQGPENQALLNEKEYNAYKYVIKILAKQEYSVHKIRIKLIKRGLSKLEIDHCIEKLISEDILSDKRYADLRIQYLMKKNYSLQYIKQKLKNENVHVELCQISNIFDDFEYTLDLQISKLISKKLKLINSSDQSKIKYKLLSYLSSRGHFLTDVDHHIKKHCEKQI